MANLFSSGHIHFFPSSATTMLVVWCLPTATVSAHTFKAKSKVNLQNDDTYRWNCAAVIVSSFGQIEQGAH